MTTSGCTRKLLKSGNLIGHPIADEDGFRQWVRHQGSSAGVTAVGSAVVTKGELLMLLTAAPSNNRRPAPVNNGQPMAAGLSC